MNTQTNREEQSVIEKHKRSFNVYPAGYYGKGRFSSLGQVAYFWSSTAKSSTYAWGRFLHSNDDNLRRYDGNKKYAHSCRCLKN